jgi:hypothetical protein
MIFPTMVRRFAVLVLFASLTSPVWASPVTPIRNPCALTAHFQRIHRNVAFLIGEAEDLGHTVERIHNASRWYPYRRVEVQWSDIHARVLSEIIDLSDFPLALDTAVDNPRKKAAEDVVTAYQNTLERIVDYASVGVYVERTENDASYNIKADVLAFGVGKSEVPQTYNAIARNHFLAHFLTLDRANHALALSEQRYDRICGANLAVAAN